MACKSMTITVYAFQYSGIVWSTLHMCPYHLFISWNIRRIENEHSFAKATFYIVLLLLLGNNIFCPVQFWKAIIAIFEGLVLG